MMIISQIFLGCMCVGFHSCTFVYNTDCKRDEYQRHFVMDNTIIEDGLLEEKQADMRADCFPLCDQHENCNLVLYNSVTHTCRVYYYRHYDITEAEVTEAGWQHFGVSCKWPSDDSDCDVVTSTLSTSCSSCLDGNKWEFEEFCQLFQISNLASYQMQVDLPFTLSSGMAVSIRGSLNVNENYGIQFYLRQRPNYQYYVGVDIYMQTSRVETKTETQVITYQGAFPVQDPLDVTLKLTFNGTKVQVYVDGKFISMVSKPLASLNAFYYYGFNTVYQGHVFRVPFYCN